MSRCRNIRAGRNDSENPDTLVKLTGQDGNAFAILGCCREAARNVELSDDEIAAFMAEAMTGDYDHLLQTAVRWFLVRQDVLASP